MSGIGVNLRVTSYFNQGGRKYMEDMFSIAYEKNLDYAFFGIFDGHGGPQAAKFVKENLLNYIINERQFWSNEDADVLGAIRVGYIKTHYAMWEVSETWPKTSRGLPCTSGCTATVAFIMRGKIYVGHVGDSAIVLGHQEDGVNRWKAKKLTSCHKPGKKEEKQRIKQCGGEVIKKSGVHRVVWNRPRLEPQGTGSDSPLTERVAFLAVARSLGDFWSYNAALDQFVISPEPELLVYSVDVTRFRCLVMGTDGLWDMLTAKRAVSIVQGTETCNQEKDSDWFNPSKALVEKALKRWAGTRYQADNTSAMTLMLDPPSIHPHSQVVFKQMKDCHEDISVVDEKGSKLPILKYRDTQLHSAQDSDRFEVSEKPMSPVKSRSTIKEDDTQETSSSITKKEL